MLLVLLFGQEVLPALGLAAFMMLIYVPMGYAIDKFFYNRRQAQKLRAKQARRG